MGLTIEDSLQNMLGRIDSMSVRTFVQAIVQGQMLGVSICLLYTSPSPRDLSTSRMPSSA